MTEKDIKELDFKLENTYAELPEIFFTEQNPSEVPSPSLVKLNYSLAEELGLNGESLDSNYGIEIFSGNKIPKGAKPITMAYGGHQFGHFAMLGDGRAVLLGEYVTSDGHRFDIQLKGSGRTKYSRGGDGKAALGPMLREYIISEGMYGLGIPTTRSLAVVTTGETILRERELPAAVLTRVASSHLRVGTFQFASNWGTTEEVKALANYSLVRHFKGYDNAENPYLFLLQEVVRKQAELISKWMLVGFIHGVMNTDNMAISGETIDYGPCAFMDVYDSKTVFSSIDRYGRYAYGNQPNIGAWNLARFAETLLPFLHEDRDKAIEIAQKEISNFSELYKENWLSGMRAKLGLFNKADEDQYLIEGILSIMEKYKADYTNTFVALTTNKIEESVLFGKDEFDVWYKLWQERLDRQDNSREESRELMENSNPVIIPRNHRVEEALEAAEKGDYTVMEKLLDALSNPYDYSKDLKCYSEVPEPSETPYRTYCGT